MALFAVHESLSHGPRGVWRDNHGTPESRYDGSEQGVSLSKRGESIMGDRGGNSWEEWVDDLAHRSPYFDRWSVLETDANTLDEALREAKKRWVLAMMQEGLDHRA